MKKRRVLHQACAFSVAVMLVGVNAVPVVAADNSSTATYAITDEIPETSTPITISFNCYDYGEMTDQNDGQAVTYENLVYGDKVTLPNVAAYDGYEFIGWGVNTNGPVLFTKGDVEYNDLVKIIGTSGRYLTLSAIFKEKDATPEQAKAKISVSFIDENGVPLDAMPCTVESEETGVVGGEKKHTFTVGDITLPEGYVAKTATWTYDVEYGAWDATSLVVKKKEAESAEATLYVHYTDESGVPLDGQDFIKKLTKTAKPGEKVDFYASDLEIPDGYELAENATWSASVVAGADDKDVNVKLKKVENPSEEKNVIIMITPGEGKFTKTPDQKVLKYETKQFAENEVELPEVTAPEGYKLSGWAVSSNGLDWLDAEIKKFGTCGLGVFKDGANEGYISVDAVFEPVEAETEDAVLRAHYVDESGVPYEGQDFIQEMSKTGTKGEDATFYATDLVIPEGYTVAEDHWSATVAYGDEKDVNVKIKPVEAETEDAVLRAHYVDEDGVPYEGQDFIQEMSKTGTKGEDATFYATDLVIPEGYTVAEDHWSATVAYGDEKDVNVKLKSVKEDPATERSVIVTISSGLGKFVGEKSENLLQYKTTEFSGNAIDLPKVEAPDGYEFTGWTVSSNGLDFLPVEATQIGTCGLACFPEGSDEGYVSLEAVFEHVEPIGPADPDKPIVTERGVTVTISAGEGKFVDSEDDVIKYETTEFAEDPIDLPQVEAPEGYEFTGWTVSAKEPMNNLEPYAKTFGTCGVAYFADGDDHGYISLEALYQKVDTVDPIDPDQPIVVNPTDPTDPTDPSTPSKDDTKPAEDNKTTTDDKKSEDTKKSDDTKKTTDTKKKSAKKADEKKSDTVQTGDHSNVFVYVATLVLAGAAAVVAFFRRRNA